MALAKESSRNYVPFKIRECWGPACTLVVKFDPRAHRFPIPMVWSVKHLGQSLYRLEYRFQSGTVVRLTVVALRELTSGDRSVEPIVIVESTMSFGSELARTQGHHNHICIGTKMLEQIRDEAGGAWHGPSVVFLEEIRLPIARWFNDGRNNVDQVIPGQYGHETLFYCPFIESDLERVTEEAWDLENPYTTNVDEYC